MALRLLPCIVSTLLLQASNLCAEVFWLQNEEAELLEMIATIPNQKRTALELDPRLCAAARSHAAEMVRTKRFSSHDNAAGIGPNERVRRLGYALPDSYGNAINGVRGNYIENIYGSSRANRPKDAFKFFLNSPNHLRHVRGDAAFFAAQTMVGVGFAANPANGIRAFVFIAAHPPKTKSPRGRVQIRIQLGWRSIRFTQHRHKDEALTLHGATGPLLNNTWRRIATFLPTDLDQNKGMLAAPDLSPLMIDHYWKLSSLKP